MFDKLIESDSHTADVKKRGRYFMVSTLVVGSLFLTAVVFSLYAADIDIGADNLDMYVLLKPIADDIPTPPEPAAKLAGPQQSTSDKIVLPSRKDLIAQIDDHRRVPDTVSSVPNNSKSIPAGDFFIGRDDNGGSGPPAGAKGTDSGAGDAVRGTGNTVPVAVVAEAKPPEPPPVLKRPPPVTQSKGVINSLATHLPHPPYPETAKAMGVEGNVSVQVTINEAGRVTSATAVDGHPTLRTAAARAARQARFTPTYLNNVPVKVTGMIVYRFQRN
ncbi:MAG: TonB family protein [Blastocatellia bacterium]|nr:TonB family protein [Blastocatellia bacterium]